MKPRPKYRPLSQQQAAMRDSRGSRLVFNPGGHASSVWPGRQPYGIRLASGMMHWNFDTPEAALKSRLWWPNHNEN